jgi:hypothetical protein
LPQQDRYKGSEVAQAKPVTLVPVEQVTQSILVLRCQKVLLDAELAAL